ncbi:MAG: hypothetical protein ACK45R_02790 [Candidatus Kapaibacterium sp.]|jgi:hypothetical protein
MKNLPRGVCVLMCVCLTLTGCVSFVGEKLLPLRKGMTMEQVVKTDELAEEKKVVPLLSPDLDSKHGYTALLSSMRSASEENRWVYIFKDAKLLYWGYPYQITRHPDDEIRIAGEVLVRELTKKDELNPSR